MTSIIELLEGARRAQQGGNLPQAEFLCRQILQLDPQQVDALFLLAVIAYQVGRHDLVVEYAGQALRRKPDWVEAYNLCGVSLALLGRFPEAVASYQQAVRLRPDYAEGYSNLGLAFQSQGRWDEAAACHQQVLRLRPDHAEAHNNLGVVLHKQGKRDEAIACFQRAVQLKPDLAQAQNNLGNAWKDQGKLDEAIACLQMALQLQPHYAEAHANLAAALQLQGKLDEAVAHYQQALRLKPDHAEAYTNLGVALQNQGKREEAIACHQQALRLNPNDPIAYSNLGGALHVQGKLEQAVACFEQALRLKPDLATACNNLGTVYRDQGRIEEAIACFRRAVQMDPGYVQAHSNLIYTLYLAPSSDAATLYEACCRWNQQHAEPLASRLQPHPNDRSPERRLRIGYVSPDFRQHPVGQFLLPLLEEHNHEQFEIFCYSSLISPDELTGRCRAEADEWREIYGASDEQAAQLIRQDRIDILVDLTMHMAGNRLLIFARKPAPVQVTYLAYCGTTGLRTVDYRLTDPYMDPPGKDDCFYSEQSIHLPQTFWCYQPPTDTPAVASLPALQSGQVTFGCLNNFCKVTVPTLETWGRLLQQLPAARLLLHALPGSHRDRVRDLLARHGVAPERVIFVGRMSLQDYFRAYEQIDVALDPFPYGGGTTSCDALWMGVPVVTLAGRTGVGRGGLSLLSNLGLTELAAHDTEEYVRIAVELARDLPRLSQLRATLRQRMQGSPLMDAVGFARSVEAAYRDMWRRWCGG